MPFWKHEDVQALMSKSSREQMFEAAVLLARQLGMEYLCIYIRSRHATLNPYTLYFSNYPAQWQACYDDEQYLQVDPTIAHCRNSLMPLLWTDEVFRETPQLRQQAIAHGLCYGWSQSAQDPRGNQSILSVARSQGPVEMGEFYEKVGQTTWLCTLVHTLMIERLHPIVPGRRVLSGRETEVLSWTAEGKTASEIACILTLSESTVNFHIRNVNSKLGVSKKTKAVSIAKDLGLL